MIKYLAISKVCLFYQKFASSLTILTWPSFMQVKWLVILSMTLTSHWDEMISVALICFFFRAEKLNSRGDYLLNCNNGHNLKLCRVLFSCSTMGCFIYILDCSNFSSFKFWSSQFACSNWTDIWTQLNWYLNH